MRTVRRVVYVLAPFLAFLVIVGVPILSLWWPKEVDMATSVLMAATIVFGACAFVYIVVRGRWQKSEDMK